MVSLDPAAQSDSLRSVSEVVTKAIILRITAGFIVGHLTTLRHRQPRKAEQVLEIIVFLMIPTLPLAQFVIHIVTAVRIRWTRERESEGDDWRFYFLVAAGVHTVLGDNIEAEDAETIPISRVQPEYLTAHNGEYLSWTWLGRLLAIICWIAQAIMTLILWIRRYSENALWQIDDHNILIAIGALAAACSCFVIHVANRRYTWDQPQHATYSRHQRAVTDSWAPNDLAGRNLFPWDFRTWLFWDIEMALIINRLLLAVPTRPYSEMVAIFRYRRDESTIFFVRGLWMLFNLVFLFNLWIPLAHTFMTSLGRHGRMWNILVKFLYGLRLIWPPIQGSALLMLLFWGIGWELSLLVGCPRACAPAELHLMWKDPLENRLFIF